MKNRTNNNLVEKKQVVSALQIAKAMKESLSYSEVLLIVKQKYQFYIFNY
jgi:hypothetical protein